MHRGSADSRGNDDGIGLENDAIVDDFVNSQGYEVVVFDNGTLVDRVSVSCVSNQVEIDVRQRF